MVMPVSGPPDYPWDYRQDSRVDRLLHAMECAVKGHHWWRVLDVRVCGRCGKVDTDHA